jgi:hypothetical protein
MRQLTWSDVVARRLARHHLTAPAADPVTAVAAMCGAHAQVRTAAEISVALRVTGGTRAGVRSAPDLVRTFGPRGTIHLLPRRDLPMWTGALSALPAAAGNARTDEIVDAVRDALGDAPEPLTTDELTAAVVARTGPWAGEPVMPAFQGFWARWRQEIPVAAHRGVLCFGPDRGRQVTYVSPGIRPDPPATAIRELIRSYLHAYGPATPAQTAQWLATSKAWLAEHFTEMAGELSEVDVEGHRGWLTKDDDGRPGEGQGVHLLPYFDAYAVGSHPRDVIFPGPAAGRALTRGQAGNYPALLLDGVVGGVWHQRRTGRRLAVTVEPLRPLTRRHRAGLDDQAARLGEILAATPTLTIGPIGVGPHA